MDVVILDIDKEHKRISLGLKQLNDPWKDVSSRYAKDQEVPVKVVRLADFGAFVELEEGIEGLIHISQLSRQRVEKPQDVLLEGQEITARILEVNPEERRIRLSLRSAQDEEETKRRDEDRVKRKRPDSERTSHPQKTQLPQEETAFTIGDLLQAQEKKNQENNE